MSRPDLTWLRDAVGLGSVFEAIVARAYPERGLLELAFEGGTLLAPTHDLAIGTRVRVRIPAREVILATSPPDGLSLHNVLSGTVAAVHAEPPFDQVMVQIAVGGVLLLAEVTPTRSPAWESPPASALRADQVRFHRSGGPLVRSRLQQCEPM